MDICFWVQCLELNVPIHHPVTSLRQSWNPWGQSHGLEVPWGRCLEAEAVALRPLPWGWGRGLEAVALRLRPWPWGWRRGFEAMALALMHLEVSLGLGLGLKGSPRPRPWHWAPILWCLYVIWNSYYAVISLRGYRPCNNEWLAGGGLNWCCQVTWYRYLLI